MRLRMSPNSWGCSVTSAAMAMDIEPRELMDLIGHDGSDIVFPGAEEPFCRRGFHVQELIDAGRKLGFAWIMFESNPIGIHGTRDQLREIFPEDERLSRMQELMDQYTGCMFGRMLQRHHWVAWDGKEYLDPRGFRYPRHSPPLEALECFWAVVRWEHTCVG